MLSLLPAHLYATFGKFTILQQGCTMFGELCCASHCFNGGIWERSRLWPCYQLAYTAKAVISWWWASWPEKIAWLRIAAGLSVSTFLGEGGCCSERFQPVPPSKLQIWLSVRVGDRVGLYLCVRLQSSQAYTFYPVCNREAPVAHPPSTRHTSSHHYKTIRLSLDSRKLDLYWLVMLKNAHFMLNADAMLILAPGSLFFSIMPNGIH